MQVPAHVEAMNSGDVFVYDCQRAGLFVWCGNSSTHPKQLKGMAVAKAIQSHAHALQGGYSAAIQITKVVEPKGRLVTISVTISVTIHPAAAACLKACLVCQTQTDLSPSLPSIPESGRGWGGRNNPSVDPTSFPL